MLPPEHFKPYAPDVHAVVYLEAALPPEHPVHVFVDLVRSIDVQHFVIPPGPKGEKPYHPHALFGVLAWGYGYLHGVRSSRKLARLAVRNAHHRMRGRNSEPVGDRGKCRESNTWRTPRVFREFGEIRVLGTSA